MINIRSLKNLTNGDGMTLKRGKKISYKTGYQVADVGIETTSAAEAMKVIKEMFHGDCGIWYENNIYYIDHSFRVKTKKEALRIGKEHNQISVLKWSNMSLIYCKDAK